MVAHPERKSEVRIVRRVRVSGAKAAHVGCVFACSIIVTACHSSSQPAPRALTNGVAVGGKGFGDTATFKPRIIALDKVDERAMASVASPSYVVVLGVIPGREIELIEPGDAMTGKTSVTGQLSLSMQRYEVDATATAAIEARRAADDRRCDAESRAREEAAARAARASQKRDSSGRVISGASDAQVGDAGMSTASIPCSGRRRAVSAKPPLKRASARPAGERYLVMLVSSSPLQWDFINERMATLTAVAPDAATTIEAIAAGLYAGTPGSWAGYFVAW